MNTFTQISSVKNFPILPYGEMKAAIIGKKYDVTLAFIGNTKARELNQTYRSKDYVPNVLSFPLTDDCGEIYIAPMVAKKEAASFGMTHEGYIGYLFIHGLLHLKGLDHGPEMEKLEAKYKKRFKLM